MARLLTTNAPISRFLRFTGLGFNGNEAGDR
jgi:hypothetical protein